MFVTALITGIALGSMYGLLALGFYVTYAVSSTVNFAQGSSMMLGAVFAYTRQLDVKDVQHELLRQGASLRKELLKAA